MILQSPGRNIGCVAPSIPPRKEFNRSGMKEKALIAEDNDDMRDLLQEALEYAGYETLVAANGCQALAHTEGK